MKTRQAYKFELKLTAVQKRTVVKWLGCARWVYNHFLDWQEKRYEEDQSNYVDYNEFSRQLTVLKTEKEWFKEPPAQTLQQTLMDLEKAYKNFFNPKLAAKKPVFKCKYKKHGIRFPQASQFEYCAERGSFRLPKLGWVRLFHSRQIEGKLRNATLSYHAGRFFLSVQTEMERTINHTFLKDKVGLDLGIVRFCTLHTGQYFSPINVAKKHQARLAVLQRRRSKMVKGSVNYRRISAKIQKLHKKIADARKDFLHKLSLRLAQTYQTIYVKDLDIQAMRVKKDETEKKKRARNFTISDQGWGMFVEMLKYKSVWRGGKVIKVEPHYTSRRCPECGYTDEKNRETQANFCCLSCGFKANADWVGARNVFLRGEDPNLFFDFRPKLNFGRAGTQPSCV